MYATRVPGKHGYGAKQVACHTGSWNYSIQPLLQQFDAAYKTHYRFQR